MTSQKQGWLYKQGGITNGWKKKYCVLQHNILLIFDKETVIIYRKKLIK